MKAIYLALLLSYLTLSNPGFCNENEAEKLSKCSIKYSHVPSSLPIDTCGHGEGELPSGYGYILLKRHGTNLFVAVIKKTPKTLLLNPIEEKLWNYGEMPSLEKMTKIQADYLWGLPISKRDSNEFTYQLAPSFSNDPKSSFFIDVVFENDRLKTYRIRDSYKSFDWHLVNRGQALIAPALLSGILFAVFIRNRKRSRDLS